MIEKTLSIIIPIHNEEGNIIPLFNEIKEAVVRDFLKTTIVFVNDGSTDNSFSELQSLSNATILDLRKNYGQAVAFDAGFKLGMTGDDVKELQKYLNTHGYVLANSGAGSPNNETTYFGNLTKQAVIKYQTDHHITPNVGYFGFITRISFANNK